MINPRDRLNYVSMILTGMILMPIIAYFNILNHIEQLTPIHFVLPVIMGALTGFAFANLYALHKVNKELQQSKNEFKYMTDNVSGKFALYRYRYNDSIITYASKGTEFLVGKQPEEIIGHRWQDVANFDNRSLQKAEERKTMSGKNIGKIFEEEYDFIDSNGNQRYWMIHEYVSDENGELTAHGIVEDVTRDRLKTIQNRLYSNIFSHIKQAFIVTDASGRIEQLNDTFAEMCGYSRSQLLGNTPAMFHSGEQDTDFYKEMWTKLHREKVWEGELWNRKRNGDYYYFSLSISAVLDDQGTITHYIGIYNDMTEHKRYIDTLENNVNYDPLTRLPNRALLMQRIDMMIQKSKRINSLNVIAFIDLDGFKEVNDNFGHDAGDSMLCTISDRLSVLIRPEDTLARLGGDEFVILLEMIDDDEEVNRIMQNVITEIKKPVNYGGYELRVSASIGLSIYQGHEIVDTGELIRRADKAMYLVKMNGKCGFQYY